MQEFMKATRGMAFNEENRLTHLGFQYSTFLSWNFDPVSTYFYKEHEAISVQTSEFLFYLVIERQNIFNNVKVFIFPQHENPIVFCSTFLHDFTISQYPLNGKTVVNASDITLVFNNFDTKYKSLDLSIAQLGISVELEVFKKTTESLITINSLNQDASEFDYMYQDSNKLVTGFIEYSGQKYNIEGANALVEWRRSVAPWKTHRTRAVGFSSTSHLQIALSIGESISSKFSKATADCFFYGKKVFKLGQGHIEYLDLNQPYYISTRVFNSTSLRAVFHPIKTAENFQNYYIAKKKDIIVNGVFIGEFQSLTLNLTFEAKGFIHIDMGVII